MSITGNNSIYRNIITINSSSDGIVSDTKGDDLFYSNIITILQSGDIASGISLSGGSNTQVYNNNITRGGISILNSANISIYYNNITNNNSDDYGITLTGTSNSSVYNNIITTYNKNSPGIEMTFNVYNNTFYDNNITTKNISGSFGISMKQMSVNNTFYRNTISSLTVGIMINGSAPSSKRETRWNTFTNDTIVPCSTGCSDSYYDIILTANVTDITFLNVSFNKSRISIVPRDLSVPRETNNLTVQWYLQVNVTNSTNNVNISGAQVVINDSFATNIFNGTAENNGVIPTQIVTEFTMNGSTNSSKLFTTDSCVGIDNVNITCFAPFNISVNYTGYLPANVSFDINRSRLLNISLTIIPSGVANIDPTIMFDPGRSSTLAGTDPTEGGTTLVWFVFNVTDDDGQDDIDEEGTRFNITLGSIGFSQWRYNNTCINVSKIPSKNRVVFNCSVFMRYFDNNSAEWYLNATGKDLSSAKATNDSETFTYNELSGMSISVAYINWTDVNPGQNDQATASPLILNNTGNDDFDQINITASHLFSGTDYLGVGNFTINSTDQTAGKGMALNDTAQVILDGDSAFGINLTLKHGHTAANFDYNDLLIGARGNQSLYFWVDIPSDLVGTGKFNNTWNITVIDVP